MYGDNEDCSSSSKRRRTAGEYNYVSPPSSPSDSSSSSSDEEYDGRARKYCRLRNMLTRLSDVNRKLKNAMFSVKQLDCQKQKISSFIKNAGHTLSSDDLLMFFGMEAKLSNTILRGLCCVFCRRGTGSDFYTLKCGHVCCKTCHPASSSSSPELDVVCPIHSHGHGNDYTEQQQRQQTR